MSDYSTPGVDDTLDSVLRRELPRTTSPSASKSDIEENQSQPIESRVEHPPTKRRRRSPQRYSPSMITEPVAGPSRLTTGAERTGREERPKKAPPQVDKPERRGRPKKDPPQGERTRRRGRPRKDPPPQVKKKTKSRMESTQTDSNHPKQTQSLRGRRRGRPPCRDSRTRSQSGTMPTDSVQPKRIPVKDRWIYTSSSSETDREKEDSLVPAHTPTRGQARYALRRDRVKKDHQRGCPCCQYHKVECKMM